MQRSFIHNTDNTNFILSIFSSNQWNTLYHCEMSLILKRNINCRQRYGIFFFYQLSLTYFLLLSFLLCRSGIFSPSLSRAKYFKLVNYTHFPDSSSVVVSWSYYNQASIPIIPLNLCSLKLPVTKKKKSYP